MGGYYGFLRVALEPGMFADEYIVTFRVGDKEMTSMVSGESVKVESPPVERGQGQGLLRVRVLDVDPSSGSALVDLPRPSFTSEPRFIVPRGHLIPT